MSSIVISRDSYVSRREVTSKISSLSVGIVVVAMAMLALMFTVAAIVGSFSWVVISALGMVAVAFVASVISLINNAK